MSKVGIHFKVDKELRDSFVERCAEIDSTVSQELRFFMRCSAGGWNFRQMVAAAIIDMAADDSQEANDV